MADTGSGITDFPVLVVTVIVGATALVLVYISNLLKASKKEEVAKSAEVEPPRKEKHESVNAAQKHSKKKHAEKWSRESKQSFSHPWLLTSLKGHSGQILDMDFSSNGKFLVSCADDRTLFIWSTKDLNQKDHKSLRYNVEYDHATFVKWSPDSKAFIIHKATENAIEVYKVGRRPDGWVSGVMKAFTYNPAHEDKVIGMGIACSGKYIMSCSEKTDLILWDLKGQQLAKVDTYLMSTVCARISPCGRFVVASGFTPDVKVWEVCFSKTGDFQSANRVFELSGHSSGVYDFDFSADSSVMATVSKDGTWKTFDTKIEYKKGEDPHLLMTGKYTQHSPVSHIALSPNAEVVAVSSGNSLFFYSALSGECDGTISNVFSGPITRLLFDASGKFLLAAGDKHIRVFHNVTGYRTTIASNRAKLRQTVSSAQKERMEQQIKESENFLKNFS